MDEKILNKMYLYIEKVAQDAFNSEERHIDFNYQMCSLDDTMMLTFKTGFDKVSRRIAFRLVNNFEKNFKYRLYVDNPWATSLMHKNGIPKIQLRRYNPRLGIDPNHTIAVCAMLGRLYSIETYRKDEDTAKYLNPDFENDAPYSIIYKKLEELCDNPSALGWDDYCRLYEKLYGFMPRAQDELRLYPLRRIKQE